MNINRRGDAFIASSLFCAIQIYGRKGRCSGGETGTNGWTSWHNRSNTEAMKLLLLDKTNEAS